MAGEIITDVERILEAQTVEGEIGLVIDYQPGRVLAIDVLQAAMGMIEALDKLDATLLSSVDTSLEPVSVLNDVQHSSLKMLLARALRNTPDELLGTLDWKKWVGGLLVKGKYKLLQKIDADAPEVQRVLSELESDYRAAPSLVGYSPPLVSDVLDALDGVAKARASLPGQLVKIQTELGDIYIPETTVEATAPILSTPTDTITNTGVEFFKVKYPDLLGSAQWTVLRNNRSTKVDMLHQGWLDAYHRREHVILPGDSLKCRFEERVSYDELGNELERKLSIVEVLAVITPPVQHPLI
jgi:hypothetical protein